MKKCPVCDARNEVNARRCAFCSVDLYDSKVQRLTSLRSQRDSLDREANELIVQIRASISTQTKPQVPEPSSAPASVQQGATTKPSNELSELGTQKTLLALGGSLLCFAIVIFLAITWPSLSVAAQASVLVAITAACMAVSVFLKGHNLNDTAEWTSALASLLVIGDAYGVRHSLVKSGSDSAFWAVALIVVGAILYAYGYLTKLRVPIYVMCVTSQAPALLTLLAFNLGNDFYSYFAVLFAAQATVNLLISKQVVSTMRNMLRTFSMFFFIISYMILTVLIISHLPDGLLDGPQFLAALIAVACLGLFIHLWIDDQKNQKVIVFFFSALCFGLASWFALSFVSDRWTVSVELVLAIVFVLITRALKGNWNLGFLLMSSLAVGIFVLAATAPVVTAVTKPILWMDEPWSGDIHSSARESLSPDLCEDTTVEIFNDQLQIWETRTERTCDDVAHLNWPFDWHEQVAVLLGGIAAVMLFMFRSRKTSKFVPEVLNAATAAFLVIVPLTINTNYLAAICWSFFLVLTQTALIFAIKRMRNPLSYGVLSLLGIMLTFWVLVDYSTTVSFYATIAAIAAGIAAVATVKKKQMTTTISALAAILYSYAALNIVLIQRDSNSAQLALTLGIFSGVVSLSAYYFRSSSMQLAYQATLIASAGLAVFSLRSGPSIGVTSIFFAIATAFILVHALLQRNTDLLVAAGCTALISLFALFRHEDITLVEAYSVPAALLALGTCWNFSKRGKFTSSWQYFGLPIGILLVPSVLALYGSVSSVRASFTAILAVAILLWGATRRQQAQFVLGALALGAVAYRVLAPLADELPRWVVVGVPGLILFIAGAYWESTRKKINQAKDFYETLR